jgi:hypothetical protein
MADLYWNAPSSPAYYTTPSNWRIGSPSGTVSSSAPTSSDNVYFSSGGTTVACIFDTNPTVNAFIANDPSGSLQSSFFGSVLTITVTYLFDISQAGSGQASMFSQVTGGPSTSSVVVNMQTSAGNQVVKIGPYQIGGLIINNTGGVPATLSSTDGATDFPFKCYSLQILAGTAEFVISECSGAQLGYPFSPAILTTPAIDISSSGKLDAQFPASKKFIVYGNFYANATTSTPVSSLTWAVDTVMEFRGPAGNISVEIVPVPAYLGTPQQPRWLPFVYNYMGENADGTPTSTLGGTLKFSVSPGGTGRPIKMYGLTCTSAGSVSGTYSRGVELGYNATSGFYDVLISYATPAGVVTPIFNVNGNSIVQVTFTSGSSTQAKFKFETAVPPATAQISYTNLSYVNADTSSGTQYLAYTSDGNVDGGNNTNWQFVASAGGFLAFFF